MNIYMNMLRHAGKLRTFEKPGEGNPGGDAEAVKAAALKAAADAAAALAADAEADIAKAKVAADAAAEAAKGGDAEAVKLATEKADLLREVMDKKAKLAQKDKDLAAATEALKAFDGIDPVKVRALIKAEADAEKKALEAAGDFDRVKQMMADEHAKEQTSIKAELEAERAARVKDRSLIDELTIGNAFGNSTFIKDNLILSSDKTRQLYGAHFEMLDGRMVGYDKPAGTASRTVLVNSAGDALAFDEALTRIVDADPDKKSVTKSKVKPGASSTTTQPNDAKPAADTGLFGRSRIAASLADFK